MLWLFVKLILGDATIYFKWRNTSFRSLGLPLAQKGHMHDWDVIYVFLTVYVICCFEWRHSHSFHKFPKIYTSHYFKMSDQNFPNLKFLIQKRISYPNFKTLLYHLRKSKITTIGKGKSIKIEPTGEEL